MTKEFKCHICGKEYNSKFWYGWHLSNHKNKLNLYNFLLLVGLIASLITIYLFIFPEIKPNLSIVHSEYMVTNDENNIVIIIDNAGNRQVKITNFVWEIVSKYPEISEPKSIIIPASEKKKVVMSFPEGLDINQIVRYKIDYLLNSKDFCIEYYYKYINRSFFAFEELNSTDC